MTSSFSCALLARARAICLGSIRYYIVSEGNVRAVRWVSKGRGEGKEGEIK